MQVYTCLLLIVYDAWYLISYYFRQNETVLCTIVWSLLVGIQGAHMSDIAVYLTAEDVIFIYFLFVLFFLC